MTVTLSGALPGDDRNGIGSIAAHLIDEPQQVHVVLALVDCTKITRKIESGDEIPTARIRAIEGFPGYTRDAAELRRLWRRAWDRRTGKTELPLEIEQEIDRLTSPHEDDEDREPHDGTGDGDAF